MIVGILDDQTECLRELDKLVKDTKLAKEVKHFHTVSQFELALEYNREQLDVVIADIDLGPQNKSGTELAAQLFRRHPYIQVIYATGYNEKFSQTFLLTQANVCGYMTKPVNPSILKAYLIKAQKTMIEQMNHRFIITYQNKPLILLARSIVFIESQGHRAMIRLANQEDSSDCCYCYEKLDEIQRRLNNSIFVRTHKSYLVNVEAISRIERQEVTLFYGNREQRIPVAKNKYSEVYQKHRQYLEYLCREIDQEEYSDE